MTEVQWDAIFRSLEEAAPVGGRLAVWAIDYQNVPNQNSK